MGAERLLVSYLIVQVVDLQLVAPSTVGKVEAAVLFRREQLCVLMLLKKRGQVKEFHRGEDSIEMFYLYLYLYRL